MGHDLGHVRDARFGPFDNWWHNAYGLDVKIVSPPHMALAAGMISIELGGMLCCSPHRTGPRGAGRYVAWPAVVFAGGLLLVMVATMIITEYASRPEQHAPAALLSGGRPAPSRSCWSALGRVPAAAASRHRDAAVYMGIMLATMWILAFPARPKLAPIYTRVTHMVPPAVSVCCCCSRARDRSCSSGRTQSTGNH